MKNFGDWVRAHGRSVLDGRDQRAEFGLAEAEPLSVQISRVASSSRRTSAKVDLEVVFKPHEEVVGSHQVVPLGFALFDTPAYLEAPCQLLLQNAQLRFADVIR